MDDFCWHGVIKIGNRRGSYIRLVKNRGFLFLAFCCCLESPASVHRSSHVFPQCRFKKGEINKRLFCSANSKITKISPFSFGETSVLLGTDSSPSAMHSKAKHTGDWSCKTQDNKICYRTLMHNNSSRETESQCLCYSIVGGLLTQLGGCLYRKGLVTQGSSAVFLC